MGQAHFQTERSVDSRDVKISEKSRDPVFQQPAKGCGCGVVSATFGVESLTPTPGGDMIRNASRSLDHFAALDFGAADRGARGM